LRDQAIRTHDQDERTLAIALYRQLWHAESLVQCADGEPHFHEHARQQQSIRIGNPATECHRAGGRVHAVVGEVECALLFVERAVGAHQAHLGKVAERESNRARCLRPLQAFEIRRRLIEEHEHRVDLFHGS
jgi:hypothetical protein